MKGDIRFGGEKRVRKQGFWQLMKPRARTLGVLDIAREQRQRSRRTRTRKGEYLVLGIVLLLGGMLYVSKQPFAQYQDVGIVGNKGVSQEAIHKTTREYFEESALGMVPRASVFAFREKALEERIHAIDARAREVGVNANIFSHRITITLHEYEPWVKWCGNVAPDGEHMNTRACGFLGDNGVLFAMTNEEGTIPHVTDERTQNIGKLGNVMIDEPIRAHVEEFTRDGALPVEYAVRKFTLRADGTFRAHANEGWDIILDAETRPADAVANLRTALEQEIKEKRANLEYIDVRFGKKVFYKLK